MKYIILILVVVCGSALHSQNNWQFFVDSIPTLSSPRSCDLNNDGVQDIVFGGGTDGAFSNNGIMAVNGANGNLLWKRASRNEVFGSAIFQDINNDGIKDVFMVGRQAQLLAINGSTGALFWDYFPYNVNPADSGLYNFYNPQFIDDVSGDGIMDILVANGGDHSAPVWDTTRPPGHLMVVNALNGQLIAKAVVPDSAETYCSAEVVDIQGNGVKWVLFGTGGETLGGSFWACPLSNLLNNDLSASIQLAHDANFGFVAPASFYKTAGNQYNIFIQSYSGKLIKIKGSNFSQHWSYDLPNTESSAEPVIGNFTGNNQPDVFLFLAKGTSSAYTDYYQVLLDGATGNVVFKDSIGHIQFASGNAIDLNNDGRDEAIVSVNYMENGRWKHRLQSFDFQNGTLQEIVPTRTGVNIGSTPLFTDLDNDSLIDLVYLVKKDSLNPMGWKGVYAYHTEFNAFIPNAGIAWGSYLSTLNNGEYHYTAVDCGPGSLISNVSVVQPWCNGTASGSLVPNVTLGTGPYTYLWSTGSTNNQLTNIPSGTYSLQVTDAAGCYEIYSTQLIDPYVISFGGVIPPTCPGGTNGQAVLNSSGCPCMFSICGFLWENGITTKPNNSLQEGWASVTITHPDGCVVTDSVLIPMSPEIVNQSVLQQVTCNGFNDGAIQVSTLMASPPVMFNWSTGSSLDSISNLSPGTYVLTVSDARPCFDTLTYQITQPNTITAGITVNGTSCAATNDGEVNINSSGGNGDFVYIVNNLSYATPVISGLSAGNYTVSVLDSLGCTSIQYAVNVSSPSPLGLAFNVNAESALGANDGIITAQVSGGTPLYSYQWNDPGQQTDSTAVYLSKGWYQVVVSDSNGCQIQDSVFLGIANLAISSETDLFPYPNPSDNWVFLPFFADKVIVRDVMGRLIGTIENTKEISLLGFSYGFYYLEAWKNEKSFVFEIEKHSDK
jgi:hypothetical protein